MRSRTKPMPVALLLMLAALLQACSGTRLAGAPVPAVTLPLP